MATFQELLVQLNTGCKRIEVSDLNISSAQGRELAQALEKNTSLISLRFDDNIDPILAQAIASLLEKSKSIEELFLLHDETRDECIIPIAKALEKNTSLKKFYIYSDTLSYRGAKAIARALEKNNSITHLQTFTNNIGCDGVQAFVIALLRNVSITEHIYHTYNPDFQARCDVLPHLIECNKLFKAIDILENLLHTDTLLQELGHNPGYIYLHHYRSETETQEVDDLQESRIKVRHEQLRWAIEEFKRLIKFNDGFRPKRGLLLNKIRFCEIQAKLQRGDIHGALNACAPIKRYSPYAKEALFVILDDLAAMVGNSVLRIDDAWCFGHALSKYLLEPEQIKAFQLDEDEILQLKVHQAMYGYPSQNSVCMSHRDIDANASSPLKPEKSLATKRPEHQFICALLQQYANSDEDELRIMVYQAIYSDLPSQAFFKRIPCREIDANASPPLESEKTLATKQPSAPLTPYSFFKQHADCGEDLSGIQNAFHHMVTSNVPSA